MRWCPYFSKSCAKQIDLACPCAMLIVLGLAVESGETDGHLPDQLV